MAGAQAGQPYQFNLNFYNENSGTLTDPSSVTLDITYGQQIGFVPDVAGPFTYMGSSTPGPGQVWRQGTGQYAFIWNIPANSAQGVYVANWTCVFNGDTFLGVEDLTVTGGVPLAVPSGDTGFWTGGIISPDSGLDIEFGQTDASGITWLWQRITGWDGPDVQGGGVIARAGDHGAWASPQYFAARTLTLTVTASAPTQTLRDVARATLQQAVPVSGLAQLRYDEPVSKYAWVRRSGRLAEAYPTLTDVTFTIGLVAPDPRKYAAVQRSILIGLAPLSPGGGMVEPFTVPFTLATAAPPGTSVATNGGSFLSPPVAIVTGPITAPTLTNTTTGQAVSWSSLTLNTGDMLVVDFLNRQGYVNPSAVSYNAGIPSTGGTYWPADVGSSWWQLAAGANQVAFGGSAGSGATAAYYWHDAYV